VRWGRIYSAVERLWARRLSAFSVLVAAMLLSQPLQAADKHPNGPPPPPLPPFESLRWDKVNLRAGPGDQYPIRWVLTRKGMPVEVLDRYDVWRKIRDWQGSVGWVHERMLMGNRTVMVTGREHTIRAEPRATARPVAHAEPGVVGRLLSCRGDWCRIDAQGFKGWVERRDIFGVTANETVE
jgi:SH3-like domain-containing protein